MIKQETDVKKEGEIDSLTEEKWEMKAKHSPLSLGRKARFLFTFHSSFFVFVVFIFKFIFTKISRKLCPMMKDNRYLCYVDEKSTIQVNNLKKTENPTFSKNKITFK